MRKVRLVKLMGYDNEFAIYCDGQYDIHVDLSRKHQDALDGRFEARECIELIEVCRSENHDKDEVFEVPDDLAELLRLASHGHKRAKRVLKGKWSYRDETFEEERQRRIRQNRERRAFDDR